MSYPSIAMNGAEIAAFLAETRHAVMATTGGDGTAQLSPVWYLYRDGKFYVGVDPRSTKCRDIRRDPRVTICVDGGYPDARYVTIRGNAEIIEGRPAWCGEIEEAIARRYHETPAEADRYMQEMSGQASVMLAIEPRKIFGRNYN